MTAKSQAQSHPPTGWAFGPVVGWLMTEGRRIAEPGGLMDELCRRLLDAGAPLCRMSFGFHTLHPRVEACTFTWTRGRNASEACAPHRVEESGASARNPFSQVRQTARSMRWRLDALDPDRDHPELRRLAAEGAVECVAVPLVFSIGPPDAFIVATDTPGGFSQPDSEKFETLADFLAPVLEVIATRRLAKTLLDTYVGRRSGSRVLDGLIRRGDSETITAALWISDLRDSTALSEALPGDRLLALLNAYFELVAAAVTAHGGEILRFIGDAMLAIFPVERDRDIKTACAAALDAALDAFRNLPSLNQQRQSEGEPAIRFGIGLHVGEAIYGNVGAPDRLDFTVTGPAVNRTARIGGLTKEVDVPLLLSSKFAAQIERPLRSLGRHELRGVPKWQVLFTLADAPAGGAVASTSATLKLFSRQT